MAAARCAHGRTASPTTSRPRILRRRGRTPALVSFDDLEPRADEADREHTFDRERALERLVALIHALQPLDRQVMLLYLEGLDGAAIGEVTGMSAANVATKVHRIKKVLAARFHQGACDGD